MKSSIPFLQSGSRGITFFLWASLCALSLNVHGASTTTIASAKASTPNLTPLPPSTGPTNPQPAAEEMRALTLLKLGAGNPIRLDGTSEGKTLWFGTRTDEIVTRAHLKLHYTYSPSLIPALSHIKVYLNEEVVGIIPLAKEQSGVEQTREFDLDTRFLSSSNSLRFQLVGHYTTDCEDLMHTSLWASVSNRSRLELTIQKIALPNDLALLPMPFFDEHDAQDLILPFVFAAGPSAEAIRAAGVLASWFGIQAGYRGTRFPVLLNQLPGRHAIVIATNDNAPSGLKLPPVDGPTLMFGAHPNDPAIKMLLILGRNDSDLKLAADALALGQAVLSGPSATVDTIDYPKRRLAYDAPNWLPLDRPVKLGDMVKRPAELQVTGHAPEPIRISARIPADLMIWQNEGVPFNIKYRYTPPSINDNSRLNFSINDSFIKSLTIRPSNVLSDTQNMIVPLRDDEAQLNKELTIPAFQVGSNNQLQFRFIFGAYKQGLCASGFVDNSMAAIDADSELDFSGQFHYAAMPNLAFFVNSGFPFSKYADLAESTVVLPASPNADDIEAMLNLFGQMGESTGFPALAYQLVLGDQLTGRENSDILLIDTAARHPLLQRWRKNFPALIDGRHRIFTSDYKQTGFPYNLFDSDALRKISVAPGKATLSSDGPLSALVGFESPLHGGRSVVALIANNRESAQSALEALDEPGMISYIRGDVAILRGKTVESFKLGGTYYTGSIPFRIWIWFHISRHPLLLAGLGIGSGLIIAMVCYWALRRAAQKRLQG